MKTSSARANDRKGPVRITAAIDLFGVDPSSIERDTDASAPSAFRIWTAGSNPTDKGDTIFTDVSAATLMALQKQRGNLFSIDVDHLSLSETAPPASRHAVGWHRLEVRDAEGGKELWAVDVEWTSLAREGLEQSPPAWRYFSPAYDVDPVTREVLQYLNTALTNNPATWNVTALASNSVTATKEKNMTTKADLKAAFQKAADDASDPETATWAKAAMKAAFGDEDDDGAETTTKTTKASGDDGGSSSEVEQDDDVVVDPLGDGSGSGGAAEGAGGDAGGGGDDDTKTTKTSAKASRATKRAGVLSSRVAASTDPVVRELAAVVQAQGLELDSMRKRDEERERGRLLASREITPQLAAVLKGKPLHLVRDIVETLPKAKNAAAAESVQATRGAGQGSGTASRQTPEELAAMNARMGIVPVRASVVRDGNKMTFGAMGADEARRLLAAGKGDSK